MRPEISELLIIKETPLPHRTTALSWRRAKHGKPKFGGVYVLWWRNTAAHFFDALQNRVLHFLGPHGVAIAWEVTLARLHTAENGFLPLYVGKNAANLGGRLGQHLKLKTARTVPMSATAGVCTRMTTSCQVRDRLDRLFPELPDTRPLALDNLALSYMRVDGPDSFVERFFLEDLAIGLFRPIFNVDSER
jgi:hypothetical protein